MPERINIDTDAGPRSTVGVGTADLTSTALHEIAPSWLQDGFGVRGPQRQVQREMPVSPTSIEVGLPSGRKSQDNPQAPNSCAPTPRDPMETGTWLWGSVDGTCQWIDTCNATCGTNPGVDGGSA